MKKLICLLISIVIATGMCGAAAKTVKAADPADGIEIFADKVTRIMSKYGNLPQVSTYSKNAEMQEYQTCRLIVKSEEKLDTLNAVSVISGYRNLWILQFETPYDTAEAYEYYSALDCVKYVQPDRPVTMQSTDDYTEDQRTWGMEMTRTAEVTEFFEGISLAQVKVGIIDSGLDYNNDVFEGRLVDNGVNLSTSGEIGTAMSDDPKSHGTHIAGIVAMNTLENTKLRAYKIFNYEGYSTELLVITAIDLAVSDGMDIINLSLGTSDSEPLRESLQNAYDAGTVIVTASGNAGTDCSSFLPAAFEEAITVGAVGSDGLPADFSNYGSTVDLIAPGVDIYSCLNGNSYGLLSGTSTATPFVSAVSALMLSCNSDLTPSQIETAIKENAFPVNGSYLKSKTGSGILNAAQAIDCSRAVGAEIGVADEINYGDVTVSFSESENTVTYYTLNGTYPTKENGILYEEPFALTKSAEIMWRSFSENENIFSSKAKSLKIRIFSESDESDFTVNESGVLTGYSGSEISVAVPETVNGITVTAIGNNAFESIDTSFKEIILPDTVKSIGTKAFKLNKSIEYVKGDGLETIGESAFSDSSLITLDAKNVITISAYAFNRCTEFSDFNSFDVVTVDDYAFMGVNGISEIKLDKLKNLGAWAFRNTSLEKVTLNALESFKEYGGEYSCGAFYECKFLKEIYLPSLKEWGSGISGERAFMNCSSLKIFHAPLLTELGKYALRNCTSLYEVNLESVEALEAYSLAGCTNLKNLYLPNTVTAGENAFTGSGIEYIYFEKLKNCNAFFTKSCTVILPSTASVLGFDSSYISNITTEKVHLKIYATPGTYAQEWAESIHNYCTSEFIALPLIITSSPEHITNEAKLSVDAVGFNLTYQWYGSIDGTKNNLVLLDGETEKHFNIPEREEFAGYFCKVTSTENGVSSSAVKGAVYAHLLPADYSSYNTAKAKIPSNLSIYTDESVAALNDALAVDVSGKIAKYQDVIDAQTQEILNAISALKFKDADYTAVYTAISAVPEDLSPYTPASVQTLQEAIDKVDYSLDITKQGTVDTYANDINRAIENLEKEGFFARLFRLIAEFFKNLFS